MSNIPKAPLVFFLWAFVCGPILLVQLLTMALHHIEQVPEHCSVSIALHAIAIPLNKEMLLVDCPQVDVVAGPDKLVNLGFRSARGIQRKEFGDILF